MPEQTPTSCELVSQRLSRKNTWPMEVEAKLVYEVIERDGEWSEPVQLRVGMLADADGMLYIEARKLDGSICVQGGAVVQGYFLPVAERGIRSFGNIETPTEPVGGVDEDDGA